MESQKLLEMKIILTSKDGVEVEVSWKTAQLSELIKTMVEDESSDEDEDEKKLQNIPLPSITGDVLAKVIEFCQHQADYKDWVGKAKDILLNKSGNIIVPGWYATYIDQVDDDMLVKLIDGATYLEIFQLKNLALAKVASKMFGKTPSEICDMLGIVNDFTPEEYARVRDKGRWVESSPSGGETKNV